MVLTLPKLLKIVAFAAFVVALVVAVGTSADIGTWQEWIAGGLAVTTLAEVV